MAEPKKRTNKSKGGMRRLHQKTFVSSFVYCPSCHEPMQRHHLCLSCGKYKNEQIINTDQDKKSAVSEEAPK